MQLSDRREGFQRQALHQHRGSSLRGWSTVYRRTAGSRCDDRRSSRRKGCTVMEYIKVDSSQIAEVGFGEGFYGPETLGIKFTPTKKQMAAGDPGSEYHYLFVSPRVYR